MGSGRYSSSGLGGHRNSNGGGDCRGFAFRRCARAALVPMVLFATPVWGQSNTPSDVTINHDVLNNLGLSGRDGAGQGAAKLRPPPSRPPQSRLLVQPVREAARKPAAKSPPADSESPGRQASATKPTAAAKIASPPAAVVSEPAPVATATAPPSLSVPAVPRPPEPLDSPSSDTIAIVPPPPPPPPLEPLADSPPPPEPAAIAAAPRPSDGRDQAAGQPAGKQVATRPAATPGSAPVRLQFEAGSAELSGQARGQLATLKDLLLADDTQRVQLLAYAKGGEQQANAARRLSLSRARAVRAFLAERGVSTSRIDVRALGTKFEDGPPDRVDIVYAKR